LPDPRTTATPAEREEAFRLALAVRDAVSAVQEAVNRIHRLRRAMDGWVEKAAGHAAHDELKAARDAASAALEAVLAELVQVKGAGPDDDLQYAPKLNGQLTYLIAVIESGDGPPTAATQEAFRRLQGQAEEQLAQLRQVENNEVAAFVRLVERANLPVLEA